MAFVVVMPRRGNFVTQGLLSKWFFQEGDAVKKGQPFFTFETDKAEFTEEVPIDGILLKILCQENEDVPCLEPIAVIGAIGEDYAEAVSGVVAPAHNETPSVSTAQRTTRTPISPRAKATAEKLNVDPSLALPTGPYGLVIERDVCELAEMQAVEKNEDSVAAFKTEQLSAIRKQIAKTMRESLYNTAQLTNSRSFDASSLQACHRRLRENKLSQKYGLKISINDLILYATARTLKEFPALNAYCHGDTITYFSNVNLGIAVDTDRGLVVPTLSMADTKSLMQISAETKKLIEEARTGKIAPDLLHNATFTVSNLGMYSVESFTPILNPPQVGILGVCGITERVRTIDGILQSYPAMGLSLTYDHQVIDGAYAARFLVALCEQLEQIDVALMLQ